MSKPKLLIIGPEDDLSIDLFLTPGCKQLVDVKTMVYADKLDENDMWDFLYIRGPFVKADFDDPKIKAAIERVMQVNQSAYSIDEIHSFSDLLIEDKWRQYEIFEDIMPKTWTLDQPNTIDLNGCLIKKRISGRSRDIYFDLSELKDGSDSKDYIAQQQMDIETEYRAFILGGQLVLPLEIKSTKSPQTPTKVIGRQADAPKEVIEICHKVSSRLSWDLMGLDIAKTKGGFYLIEVNRSPQFVNYYKWNSKNLAEELIDSTLEKVR